MNIENRQQFLIVLVAVAAGLLIGNSVIVEPLSKWWSARSTKIKDLRNQVQNGKSLVDNEKTIRGRWEQMRTNTLPNNTSLAEQQVLNAFESWSRDSGATVTGIMPQWKKDSDEYTTLNCRVEASGDLRALGLFMYNIEKDPMALKLESVELSAHDSTGQQLTLGLQISGLVLASHSKK